MTRHLVVHSRALLLSTIACFIAMPAGQARSEPANEAREILQAADVPGGVVVHLGCGDGKLTAALRINDRYLVHGLDTDGEKIDQARRYIHALGLYGKVSVARFDGRRLPYTENLVNLLVAEDLGGVSMQEVMRVLCPRGVACIREDGRWTKTVKPWPEQIDEWTHYLHGPDGNPVAQDSVVGPPERYQWIAGPLWLRSHESDSSVKALVSARGRLFYIADEAPISLLGDHCLPDKWFLVARDAFNGVLLWKVPIKDWGWRAWKPSWFTPRPGAIPLNMPKRLVAAGDKVYVTLGYRAAVSELDARTGEVLQTYEGTDRTAEILYREGKLVLTLLRNDRAAVKVIDAESGRPLCTSENDYRGTVTDYYRFRAMHGSVPAAKVDPTLNTATDGKVIALLDGGDLVCLDFTTGKERWRTAFPLVEADYKAGNIDARQTLWTGTLIVHDGVVVHASPNQLAAFSADSGEILWKQPKKYLQHLWFEWKDVFVIDGLVWTWSAQLRREKLEGANQSSSWPESVNGYDLRTGKLAKKVSLGNIFKTHHHHRCYRNKATSRYILASRRGTEFVDLHRGDHTVHNWVRGTCHLGMMPANGLQYAPPHPCVCYIEEKLNGFHALAGARDEGRGARDEGRGARDEGRGARSEGRGKREEGRGGSEESDGNARLQRGPAYASAASRPSSLAPHPSSLAPHPSSLAPHPSQSATSRHSPLAPHPSQSWPTFRGDAMRSGSVKTKVPAAPKLLWQEPVGRKVGPPVVVGRRLFVPLVDEHRVVALDASDGRQLWEFAAGGRIDSPPTYYRGTVLFGSADGRVYCVRAADGVLVWRFRAAMEARLIGAFGQLESAWPVHGSVLVQDGTVYFAAGRSSHLDGGIELFGLDAVSGELKYRTKLEGPSYHAQDFSQNYRLPMGALPDVLQGADGLIHMRNLVFDAELELQESPAPPARTLVSAKGGLLDDSYFKRIPWSFGPKSPHARLVVHDEQAAYFIRMFDSLRGLDPSVYFTPGKKGYLLFSVEKATGKQTWSRRIPVRVNAMVATEGPLFVAGYPDVVDPRDPLGAFEGRKGGVLEACEKSDGRSLWQYRLAAPPVFHGLAAAGGRLYIATQDGRIACFGE